MSSTSQGKVNKESWSDWLWRQRATYLSTSSILVPAAVLGTAMLSGVDVGYNSISDFGNPAWNTVMSGSTYTLPIYNNLIVAGLGGLLYTHTEQKKKKQELLQKKRTYRRRMEQIYSSYPKLREYLKLANEEYRKMFAYKVYSYDDIEYEAQIPDEIERLYKAINNHYKKTSTPQPNNDSSSTRPQRQHQQHQQQQNQN